MSEEIYVNTATGHNKFWIVDYNLANKTVNTHYGRLGSKGSHTNNTFDDFQEATAYLRSKISEKQRNNYRKIKRPELEELATIAAIVGTKHKCSDFRWVELIKDGTFPEFQQITTTRLAEPNCIPGIMVAVEFENASTTLIVCGSDKVYSRTWIPNTRDPKRIIGSTIASNSPIMKLAKKILEAVASRFAS